MWQTMESVTPELPRWWKPSKRRGTLRRYIFTVSFGRLLFLAVMLEWYRGPVEERGSEVVGVRVAIGYLRLRHLREMMIQAL